MKETALAIRPIKRDDYPQFRFFAAYNPVTMEEYGSSDISDGVIRIVALFVRRLEAIPGEPKALYANDETCRLEILPAGGLYRISMIPRDQGSSRVNLVLSAKSVEFWRETVDRLERGTLVLPPDCGIVITA